MELFYEDGRKTLIWRSWVTYLWGKEERSGMRRGYDGRKAYRVETGLIWTHVNQTRRAAAEMSHEYIETYQMIISPESPSVSRFSPSHYPFQLPWGRTQTRTHRRLEEIDEPPSQTKIWPRGRIRNPATLDIFLRHLTPPPHWYKIRVIKTLVKVVFITRILLR